MVSQQAAQHGIPVNAPLRGYPRQRWEAELQVLGPVDHVAVDQDESSRQNDSSLVIMVRVAGLRLLLTGDVEPPGQQAILDTGADLHADVLKIPHHGSAQQDPGVLRGDARPPRDRECRRRQRLRSPGAAYAAARRGRWA